MPRAFFLRIPKKTYHALPECPSIKMSVLGRRLHNAVALVFLGASLLWVLFAIIILILGRVTVHWKLLWELLMLSTRGHRDSGKQSLVQSYNHPKLSETDRRFALHRQLGQYFPLHSSGEQMQMPHQRSALPLEMMEMMAWDQEIQQLPGNGTGALYHQG